MKNYSDKYSRHQEVARAQAHQKLQNCALLCAYVYGAPGGWYAIAKGSVDGFPSDYALVSSNPGDCACHPVRALYAAHKSELVEYAAHIAAVVQAVKDEHGDAPLVAVLTAEEQEAARLVVRDALVHYASGRIDGILVRTDEAGIEALESGTLNGGERVSKGDMLDDVAQRLTPLTDEDAAEWLRDLCNCTASDLTMTDWDAVVAAIQG